MTGARVTFGILRPGARMWRIGERGEAVLRCVVVRVRGNDVEVAPSQLSPHRFHLQANDVFFDQETARAELQRRRAARQGAPQ